MCNPENEETIKFLEKQIENIINFSPNYSNIIVLANSKRNKKIRKKFKNNLNSLHDKYCINISLINLNDQDVYKTQIYQFMCNVLFRKLKLKKEHIVKNNWENIHATNSRLD